VINLWPSIITKAVVFRERCTKGIGNAQNAEKKLQSFPLNLQQTDQFIAEIAGERKGKTASNK